MRLLFLFSFLSSSLICSAQFEFKSDSSTSVVIEYLPQPNFDSIQFEMRLWESGALIPINYFLRLSFSKSEEWHITLGIADDSLVFEKHISEEQDSLKKLWTKLNEYEILTLKDQKEAEVWLGKGDKKTKLIWDQIQKLGPTDGSSYILELLTNTNSKTIQYQNPHWFDERFKFVKENWIAPDYDKLVKILNSLEPYFNQRELRDVLLKLWAEKQKK
uniref:hypothetical protein n=1 Tax=Roseivirga sp. TaxID=1964215 RepID=UPI00404743AA